MICIPDSALPAAIEAGGKLCQKCHANPVAQPRDRICLACHTAAQQRRNDLQKANHQRRRQHELGAAR